MQASSALISCVGSTIQTNLTIVFLLVAQHNSNKFDSAFALASVDYSRLPAKLFVNTHQASQVSFNPAFAVLTLLSLGIIQTSLILLSLTRKVLLSPILLLEVTPKAIIANPRSGTLFYHPRGFSFAEFIIKPNRLLAF